MKYIFDKYVITKNILKMMSYSDKDIHDKNTEKKQVSKEKLIHVQR